MGMKRRASIKALFTQKQKVKCHNDYTKNDCFVSFQDAECSFVDKENFEEETEHQATAANVNASYNCDSVAAADFESENSVTCCNHGHWKWTSHVQKMFQLGAVLKMQSKFRIESSQILLLRWRGNDALIKIQRWNQFCPLHPKPWVIFHKLHVCALQKERETLQR